MPRFLFPFWESFQKTSFSSNLWDLSSCPSDPIKQLIFFSWQSPTWQINKTKTNRLVFLEQAGEDLSTTSKWKERKKLRNWWLVCQTDTCRIITRFHFRPGAPWLGSSNEEQNVQAGHHKGCRLSLSPNHIKSLPVQYNASHFPFLQPLVESGTID